ncbi:glutamate decarboxylase [Capronia coronata CBS 617.96]|uniref:Glutamate decarboxylase n=1 Tax=Capronia coronata CBS 617.96 TaxID=1182541 RepID=W9YYI6_9EURO|nr:glutamate decarboxylase [Capronia coronata CBS 617.96]EXJ94765.1 glutamate decarboxylase [Capronia coronata CBS 617.96]
MTNQKTSIHQLGGKVSNNLTSNGSQTYGHGPTHVNGSQRTDGLIDTTSRAQELKTLLSAVIDRLIPFIESADAEVQAHQNHQELSKSSLVEAHAPSDLHAILTANGTLSIPNQGTGQDGLLDTLASVLKYSVNTSCPGFLDKLYAAPLPPGIAADLVLSVLNTNLHVYQVSPVLSLIETHVARALTGMFGFTGPRAGGINVQGGSASNLTSIVIARNTLFPDTKRLGNNAGGRSLVLFTSEHGHYSIEKAAQQCGFGSASVVSVPVDPVTGEMDPTALETLIIREKRHGKTPFYVNATAGTTVLGSFDPFAAIAEVVRKYGLWLHIDGAWGGSFVFSEVLRQRSLRECNLADSIAINPHKMLGVPVTCSFLLLKDLRHAHRANTLRAGYLFHDKENEQDEAENDPNDNDSVDVEDGQVNGHAKTNGHIDGEEGEEDEEWTPPDDLADLTLQCGRRGDSLKFFFAWQYYGTSGYRAKIENAYSVACHFADLVDRHPDLVLVSTNPPPCLQVCFYFAPGGRMVYNVDDEVRGGKQKETQPDIKTKLRTGKRNSSLTSRISQSLIPRGFLVDFAPALSHEVEKGSFFRAVVNISTTKATVERLVDEVGAAGRAFLQNQKKV